MALVASSGSSGRYANLAQSAKTKKVANFMFMPVGGFLFEVMCIALAPVCALSKCIPWCAACQAAEAVWLFRKQDAAASVLITWRAAANELSRRKQKHPGSGGVVGRGIRRK